jgi:hypothetical protein
VEVPVYENLYSREVKGITDFDGERSIKNNEHRFLDAGDGGTVDGGIIDTGHPGEEEQQHLRDGGDSHHGEVRDITDLGGDNIGDGGSVDEGEVDAGHPGEPGFLALGMEVPLIEG